MSVWGLVSRVGSRGSLLRGLTCLVASVFCVFVFGVGVAGARMVYGDVCGSLGAPALCTGGEFNTPLGVAVDDSIEPSAGDVYVVDINNKRVVRFDSAGKELGVVEPPGGFSAPYFDAVDPANGDLYVTDNGSGSVYKFNPAGELVVGFATGGVLGGLSGPSGVAVDPSNGSVFVAQRGNSTIVEYDSSGKELGSFTISVQAAADGIAVDSEGNVYAIDEKARLVEYPVSNRAEELVLDTNAPFAVTIDPSSKDLYVAENRGEGWLIAQYGPGFTPVTTFGLGDFSGSGPGGLAVNGVTHAVYASDIESNLAVIFNQFFLPSATTDPAKNVTASTAELCGTVNPESETLPASYQFDYGTETTYGKVLPASPVNIGTGEAPQEVCANLEGLNPAETIHYQILASNNEGQAPGGDETIKTPPVPATVDSQSVSLVEQTSAIVTALINPENTQTTYHVEYGTSTAYGSIIPVPDGAVGSGLSDIPVAKQITGLQAGTAYHYRIVATNTAGIADGPDGTFVTAPATPPVVGASSANEVSQNAVSLSGTVNPDGLQTYYEFDLGTDTGYGTRVFGNAGFGASPVSVGVSFQNLAAGTTYHYRLIASNVYGTIYGPDQTFTTPTYPTATLSAPPTSALIPVPTVVFPAGVTVPNSAKAKQVTKTKPKGRAKKKRKGGKMARRSPHRHAGKGRAK
jgi:DNA-binding beta-propeller fold protein YncE